MWFICEQMNREDYYAPEERRRRRRRRRRRKRRRLRRWRLPEHIAADWLPHSSNHAQSTKTSVHAGRDMRAMQHMIHMTL